MFIQRLLLYIFLFSFFAYCSHHSTADYPGIGFFDSGPHGYLPANPSTITPAFYLYTRQNPTEAVQLLWNNTESIVAASAFNGTRLTKMIIHGFVETPFSRPWMNAMKDAFLEADDFNVIVVDWSTNDANRGRYGQAAANTRVIGPMIGIQIEAICRLKETTPASFHLLGQSLGAHVSGFTGKYLGNGTLGQITGMDPAGVSFEGLDADSRLWFTDAAFVDVIHTDIKPIIGLGMEEPCGHVDFYPNGGRSQPGCGAERWGAFMRGFMTGARTLFGCEHYRSWAYYLAAISNGSNGTMIERARGHRCESYQSFEAGNCFDCGDEGENCAWFGPKAVEYDTKGENRIRFYLDTESSEPWFG